MVCATLRELCWDLHRKTWGPNSKGCLAAYQVASRTAKFGELSACFYYCQDILKNVIASSDTCNALFSKAVLSILKLNPLSFSSHRFACVCRCSYTVLTFICAATWAGGNAGEQKAKLQVTGTNCQSVNHTPIMWKLISCKCKRLLVAICVWLQVSRDLIVPDLTCMCYNKLPLKGKNIALLSFRSSVVRRYKHSKAKALRVHPGTLW